MFKNNVLKLQMQTMGMRIWETETPFNMKMLREFGKMKAEGKCLSFKGA